VKYILILLHQADVLNYHCMMHGTTKLKFKRNLVFRQNPDLLFMLL